MNKRTFLKLLSMGVGGQMLAPLWAAKGKGKLTNWSGNLTYSTGHIHEARSLDDVKKFVRAQRKVKALGTRHCFNTIADSRDNLLSMPPLHEVIAIDAEARTVTVDAGIKYGQLAPFLDAKGYALHNLASLPHISVAGACATATHGSGQSNGNLSTAVTGIELVNAAGDVVMLTRKDNAEEFRGAVVGLGALGVITKVTLEIQPTFAVKQYVYENLPLAQMSAHFDEIQASGYSVSLFTDWQKGRLNELWIKSRVGDGREFAAPKEFFDAKLAAKNLHPIAELSAENCTEQMGVSGPWYERLPHFKMGFTPSAGKELQSEYFVPRRQAVDAILAVERLRDQITPHLLITEIRTIAADDLWMSTAFGRPSVAIHFTWKQDWPAVQRVLPLIEKELSAFECRPHWGKLFTLKPSDLRSRYEKLPAFLELAKKYDPSGKFQNDFLQNNLFGS